MKTAILQVADSGPLESLVVMLRAAGYQCYLPTPVLRGELMGLGCDTVLDPRGLQENWGYDAPFPLPTACVRDMATADLYVDVKAHRNGPRVWTRWPRLRERTLWYRINGSRPEPGDESDPPCPVLTPNQWYATPGPWSDRSYACWPPFVRFDEYHPRLNRRAPDKTGIAYDDPTCLINNLAGWGYAALIEPLQALGVKMHGVGSPDGLIPHKEVPYRLSTAVAMVHLKSNDAPGYALYESLAAGCPVICTERLIWRCKMQDLLHPGENCLVFDRETRDELAPVDVATCTREVDEALQWITIPAYNRRMGLAGRDRLREIMWREDRDGPGFREWMGRMFG